MMYIPPPDYRPPANQPMPDEVPRNPGEPDYFRPIHRPPAHSIPRPDYAAQNADPNRVEYKEPSADYYSPPIERSYRKSPVPEPLPVPVRERAPSYQIQPSFEYSRSRAPSFTPAPRQYHVPEPEVHRGFVIDPEPDQFIMPQDPVVPTPVDVPRHYYVPKIPPRDNFIAHSYVEDKDKVTGVINDGSKSTRSHIRAIGVSVLPPIGGSDSSDIGGGVNPMRNRAFLRHLENHRNFDTMKSLKSCRECPICQLFLNEGLEIPNNMQHHFEPQPAIEIAQNGKLRRGDVRDLFGFAEVPSAPAATNWSLTRRSYVARSEGEMSVDFREKVEVIRREGTHVLCQKRDGTMGWVPSYIVM